MKNWKTVMAIALALGLVSSSAALRADQHEGSMGGHEAHGKDVQTQEDMEKDTATEGEAKQEGEENEEMAKDKAEDGHKHMKEGSH